MSRYFQHMLLNAVTHEVIHNLRLNLFVIKSEKWVGTE